LGKSIKKNKYGFRTREFVKKPTSMRIVIIGDSLTWGAGINEEKRYSDLLEKKLKAYYKNIEIYNLGIPGGPTKTEAEILKKYINIIEPNLVILGFCFNDPQPRSQDYSIERETYTTKIKGFINVLKSFKLKYFSDLILNSYLKFYVAAKKIPFWIDALDRVYDENSVEWNEFNQSLNEIFKITIKNTKTKPVFISLNQGIYNDRKTNYNKPDKYLKKILDWYSKAEKVALKNDFIVVNCLNKIKKIFPEGYLMAVAPGKDSHPNARLNEIYADVLFEKIIKLKLLEKSN
jgi:lysophospholipase L1-like esterase